MADTTFVARVTHIVATWLNDVNKAVYRAIGAGGVAPVTPADVRTNLGLSATTTPSGASLIGYNDTGTLAADDVQAALTELDLEKAPIDAPTFTSYIIVEGPAQINGMVSAFGSNPPDVIPYPTGFSASAGRFNRLVGSGGGGVRAAVNVMSQTASGTDSFEWNQLNRIENYADQGQNVSMYAQAYKHAIGATWSGVLESHDTTHIQPEAALYGLEIDVSANGDDTSTLGFPMRYGIQLVGYRDFGPNTYITGSISGTTLTVTNVEQGEITVGQEVTGTGVSGTAPGGGTLVTAFLTGSGLTGTYQIGDSQTVASESMALIGVIITAKIDNGAGAAGNTLTVTDILYGKLAVGMTIYCGGLPAGRTITALGTGTGGVGTYTISGAAALILPDTTTMTMNGGATNNVGNGLWIGAQFGDPGGTTWTNQIHLAGDGDTAMLISGRTQVGVACVGHYSTAAFISITPSSVPIISSVGSMNNALWQFAATDPVYSAAALGAYAAKVRVIIDGNPYWIPIYAP